MPNRQRKRGSGGAPAGQGFFRRGTHVAHESNSSAVSPTVMAERPKGLELMSIQMYFRVLNPRHKICRVLVELP